MDLQILDFLSVWRLSLCNIILLKKTEAILNMGISKMRS